MTEEQNELLEFRTGDKVKIKAGLHSGARGIVKSVAYDSVFVQVGEVDQIQVTPNDLTNYSRAARRAWASHPKQAGRPKSSDAPKKMVSIRLDIDLWTRLGIAAERGLIQSREQAVNHWLREKLDDLL